MLDHRQSWTPLPQCWSARDHGRLTQTGYQLSAAGEDVVDGASTRVTRTSRASVAAPRVGELKRGLVLLSHLMRVESRARSELHQLWSGVLRTAVAKQPPFTVHRPAGPKDATGACVAPGQRRRTSTSCCPSPGLVGSANQNWVVAGLGMVDLL